MPSCNPPHVHLEGRAKLETLLTEMFPDLKFIGNLLEYNLLAIPVASEGTMVDLKRMESPKVNVGIGMFYNHVLVLEITISKAVQGAGKKPKKKEFFYTLEIEPIEFVSRKQFQVEVTAWLDRKQHSVKIENDPTYLKSIMNRIHPRVMQDWLQQFETSEIKTELGEVTLYQLLYHFFEPSDDEDEIVEIQ